MSDWQHLGVVAEHVAAKTQADLEWMTVEDRAVFFGELKGYAAAHNAKAVNKWKPGWPAVQYKKRFGYYPEANVMETPELDCGPATRMWIKATMQDCWRRKRH